jgi:hypothetical protein
MSSKLSGKFAVVTGGSKGIGAGIAAALAGEGALVAGLRGFCSFWTYRGFGGEIGLPMAEQGDILRANSSEVTIRVCRWIG